MREPSHPIRQSLFGIIFLTLGGCANTGTGPTGTASPSTDADVPSGWFDGTFRTVAVVPENEPPPTVGLYYLKSPPSHFANLYILKSPPSHYARAGKDAGSGALECDLTGDDDAAGPIGLVPALREQQAVNDQKDFAFSGTASVSEGGGNFWGELVMLAIRGCVPVADAAGDMTLLNGARARFEQSLRDRRPELLVSQKIVSLMQARADHDVQLELSRKQAEDLVRDELLDRLLEIRLTHFGLVTDKHFDKREVDAEGALLIMVSTINYSLSGGRLVPEKQGTMKYLGNPRRFSALVAQDGRLLTQDIEQGTTMLAELIAK